MSFYLKENDFVFILGYPGRTYRNLPSEYIHFQEKYQLPFYAGYYQWQIKTMQMLGENNPQYAISTAPRIKSFANVMKNYQGKMKALGSLNLYDIKKAEEQRLLSGMDDNTKRSEEFRKILPKFDSIYHQIEKSILRDYWYTHEKEWYDRATDVSDSGPDRLCPTGGGEAQADGQSV
mgnify:CR=1 FL=1